MGRARVCCPRTEAGPPGSHHPLLNRVHGFHPWLRGGDGASAFHGWGYGRGRLKIQLLMRFRITRKMQALSASTALAGNRLVLQVPSKRRAAHPVPLVKATATSPHITDLQKEKFRDRGHVQAACKGTKRVRNPGPTPDDLPNDLNAYMTLDVEQYSVLYREMERIGPSLFRLTGPRVSFFSLEMEPVLTVHAELEENGGPGGTPRVKLVSDQCRVHGSDWVEALNSKFDISW